MAGCLYQAYISLYHKTGNAYIKPISAYIEKWGMPMSSLYQPISTDGGTPISSLYQPISKNGGNLYQAYIG